MKPIRQTTAGPTDTVGIIESYLSTTNFAASVEARPPGARRLIAI